MLTFATFHPLLQRRYYFGNADGSGNAIVHQQLLRWSLEASVADNAVLFEEMLPTHPFAAQEFRLSAGRAVAELPHHLRSRVKRLSIPEFPEAHDSDYVLVGRAPEFSSLCQLRRACGQRSPLSCVVHAVLSPNAVANYLGILTQAEACDRLVVTSRAAESAVNTMIDEMVELLIEAFPGVDREAVSRPRTALIPLGVDDSLLEQCDRREARKTLELPDSSPVLLYVGRLSEEYKADLEPLLRSVKELSREIPDLMLVIAGNDTHTNYSARVEALSRDLGITEHIRIISNFAPYIKKILYSASNIFVSPADNIQESYGLAVVEAMAVGLPVVASNWSGYRDLITEGVTGFLIDTWTDPSAFAISSQLASAGITPHAEQCLASRTIIDGTQLTSRLRTLLNSETLCETFGAAGRRRVLTELRWSIVIKRFGALWREQIEEADHCRFKSAHIDLSRVFGHYGSTSAASVMAFVGCEDQDFTSLEKVLPPGDRRLTLMRAFKGPIPRLFSEVLRQIPREFQGLAFNLLKKGYLRIKHKSIPVQHAASRV